MTKILVTGSNGQLGSELRLLASMYPACAFNFIDIEHLNLADPSAVASYFAANPSNFIIHAAAYTAVDKAEEEVDLCTSINATAVHSIAKAAKSTGARLLYVSTDYVFDGESNQPIREESGTNPLSVYGRTKLAGEKFVEQELDDAYIIRTAWVYSTFGKNFVKSILNLCRTRPEIGVVADQFGSPTYAHDLAAAILKIVNSVETGGVDKPGVYHFSNEGSASWYDFAYLINELARTQCKVMPIPSSAYKTAAARPKFSVLDKSKIKQTFAIDIPHWTDSLRVCLRKMEL